MLDPFLELLGQGLALEKLDKEQHALVRTMCDALPDGETVGDGVRLVRRLRREAQVEHIV